MSQSVQPRRGRHGQVRPTSITVIAVLNLLYGLYGGFIIFFILIRFASLSPLSVVPEIIHGVLLVAVFFAAGIGMLKLKRWARWLALGIAIVWAGAGVLLVYDTYQLYFVQRLSGVSSGHGLSMLILAVFVGLVLPLLYGWFLTRSYVKQAFTGVDTTDTD